MKKLVRVCLMCMALVVCIVSSGVYASEKAHGEKKKAAHGEKKKAAHGEKKKAAHGEKEKKEKATAGHGKKDETAAKHGEKKAEGKATDTEKKVAAPTKDELNTPEGRTLEQILEDEQQAKFGKIDDMLDSFDEGYAQATGETMADVLKDDSGLGADDDALGTDDFEAFNDSFDAMIEADVADFKLVDVEQEDLTADLGLDSQGQVLNSAVPVPSQGAVSDHGVLEAEETDDSEPLETVAV